MKASYEFNSPDGSIAISVVDSTVSLEVESSPPTSTTLTGDVTGTGTSSIVTVLKATGTAGTYEKVTTDAEGRVVSGSGLSAGDIPNITPSQVTGFSAAVQADQVLTEADGTTLSQSGSNPIVLSVKTDISAGAILSLLQGVQ